MDPQVEPRLVQAASTKEPTPTTMKKQKRGRGLPITHTHTHTNYMHAWPIYTPL